MKYEGWYVLARFMSLFCLFIGALAVMSKSPEGVLFAMFLAYKTDKSAGYFKKEMKKGVKKNERKI